MGMLVAVRQAGPEKNTWAGSAGVRGVRWTMRGRHSTQRTCTKDSLRTQIMDCGHVILLVSSSPSCPRFLILALGVLTFMCLWPLAYVARKPIPLYKSSPQTAELHSWVPQSPLPLLVANVLLQMPGRPPSASTPLAFTFSLVVSSSPPKTPSTCVDNPCMQLFLTPAWVGFSGWARTPGLACCPFTPHFARRVATGGRGSSWIALNPFSTTEIPTHAMSPPLKSPFRVSQIVLTMQPCDHSVTSLSLPTVSRDPGSPPCWLLSANTWKIGREWGCWLGDRTGPGIPGRNSPPFLHLL